MAKKPFEWVRDAEEPVIRGPERESIRERTADAREGHRLADLLVALPEPQLARLPLEDHILAELEIYRNIRAKAHGARRRKHKHIATMLRDADTEALARALDAGSDDAIFEALTRWRTRILDEGDAGIQAFLDAHPEGDRQRIRQLAKKAGKGDSRANKQLMAALREAAGV